MDKGKAVVIEDCVIYVTKMQDHLGQGDYERDRRKEKLLLDKLQRLQTLFNTNESLYADEMLLRQLCVQ